MTSNQLTNLEIADLLRNVAAAYQLQNKPGNKFKIIAYEKAADAVEHASSELKDIWDEGKLENVPGIGKSIAEHLSEMFEKGNAKHFDELLREVPPAVFTLMKVPGIGPKTAYKMTTIFKIDNTDPVTALKEIAKSGKIAELEGFGEASEAEILKSLEEYKVGAKRHLLPYASLLAHEIMEYMRVKSSVKEVQPLGSLRRQASTIGDIDFAVATNNPDEVLQYFVDYPKKSRALEKGEHKASILLPSGVRVDMLVIEPDAWGSALQHFTGSKHHNITLREYALKKKMSLSEFGIKFNDKLHTFKTEEKFYNFLGMDWIPPEMREDTGEIKAALLRQLPKLVEEKDIKADLQMHSSFDIETSHDLGESSMDDLVDKASERNYEYIAVTEHNPSRSRHTPEQIVDILKHKQEHVEKLNYSIERNKQLRVKRVFNSLEIDMQPNGDLPVPDAGMDTLDFALVSIHSQFRLSKKDQTARVLKALSHPKVRIFAHPTGRKLNEREGAELDWEQIFDMALAENKWIEINCDPMRLDLPDMLVRDAVKLGVKLTLGTDAHHKDALDNIPFGISVARRGWATKEDIVNTRSLEDFEKLIKGI